MAILNKAKISFGAAFILLAACGQEASGEITETTGDVEPAAASASMDRDWIPAGIALPQPHTVLQDTKIGTRTYLLQVSVPNNPEAEFSGWKDALMAAGYEVDESMRADGRLLFSGANVESGQIAVSQPMDVEGYMIQIDVSQNVQ